MRSKQNSVIQPDFFIALAFKIEAQAAKSTKCNPFTIHYSDLADPPGKATGRSSGKMRKGGN